MARLLDPDDLDSAMKKLEAKERAGDCEAKQTGATLAEDDGELELARTSAPLFRSSQVKPRQRPAREKAVASPALDWNQSDPQLSRLLKYFLERDEIEQFDTILAWAEMPEAVPGGVAFLQDLLRVARPATCLALRELMEAISKNDLLQSIRHIQEYPVRYPRILAHVASGRELLRRHGIVGGLATNAAPPPPDAKDGRISDKVETAMDIVRLPKGR